MGKNVENVPYGQVGAAVSEADARKAEIKRIKEAEQDAMARALGLPVLDRSNPNNQVVNVSLGFTTYALSSRYS